MNAQEFIQTRRDGGRHSQADLEAFAIQVAKGGIPDYQIAAWLMAAFLNPLDEEQTVWLTQGMARSGETLDLTGLPHPWVDKHSTGGVGDKTTLVILPLLASLGLTAVKMSGRGLGITGGTVDKLASIPGFRMDMSPAELKAQAAEIGLAIAGQTANLAPADKVLYSLRDATATVASIPLIVSSILSKKLAGGAEELVLDVKCGSGAFMKTRGEAQELAQWLVRIAGDCGLPTVAALTDMDQPLGRMVGNALEVHEALDLLQGSPHSPQFEELVVRLAGITLHFAGLAESEEAGTEAAKQALHSGRAAAKADQWIRAQTQGMHGIESARSALPVAPHVKLVHATRSGYVARVNAGEVGRVVVALGGGRQKKEDEVDLAVGVEVLLGVGDQVNAGQPSMAVHARTDAEANDVVDRLANAIEVVDGPIPANPVILEVIR